jgi:hypothetical protein
MIVLNYPVKRSTLATQVYRISPQSFSIWLTDIGIDHSRTLSPADLKKIINTYGLPEGILIKGI